MGSVRFEEFAIRMGVRSPVDTWTHENLIKPEFETI